MGPGVRRDDMLMDSHEMTFSLRFRAAIVSVVLFAAFLGVWHLATRSTGTSAAMSPEYAKLMGLTATAGQIGDAGAIRCRREIVGAPQASLLR